MKRLILAALAAALLAPMASAKDKGGPRGGDRPEMGEKVKEKLGLTDDQAKKFQEAMKAHQEATRPLMRKMRDGMTKLKDQLDDKAADKDIQATLDSLKSSRQALSDEQEKFHAALASFLTPTQQAKLVLGMAKRMHEHMMMGGGMGGEHRMGGHGGDHPAPKDEDHDGDEHGE